MVQRPNRLRKTVSTVGNLIATALLFNGCATQPQPRQVGTALTALPAATTAVYTPTPSSRNVATPTAPLTAAASSTPLATAVPTPEIPQSMVFALLRDNRLLAVHAPDGAVVTERRLAPPPSPAALVLTGHYMDLSNDKKRLFVLVPGEMDVPSRVVVVDVATAEVRATYPLDEPNIIFRSLMAGPKTGRLYLFGNRVESTANYPPPLDAPRLGTPAKSVAVAVLNPDNGTIERQWIAKQSAGYDWLVYQGAVSDDERQLFISYHGPDTSGIDRFEIAGNALQRCRTVEVPNFGCLFRAHAGFTLDRDGILVATGGNLILNLDSDGTIKQRFDTQLENNHLEEFVVDTQHHQIYAVGSCGYVSGFSAIDFKTNGDRGPANAEGTLPSATPVLPKVLVTHDSLTPGKQIPCGQRLALGPYPLLVVGKNARPVPSPGGGQLLFLDVRTGQIFHIVRTPDEPIDVLVIMAS